MFSKAIDSECYILLTIFTLASIEYRQETSIPLLLNIDPCAKHRRLTVVSRQTAPHTFIRTNGAVVK